jgi:glutathione peroxidase-family protein
VSYVVNSIEKNYEQFLLNISGSIVFDFLRDLMPAQPTKKLKKKKKMNKWGE